MKPTGVAGILVMLLCLAWSAEWAPAGLNPGNPGLPAMDNVYGLNGVPNNSASAMCVACHHAVPLSGRTAHFVHRAGKTTAAQDRSDKERTATWSGSQSVSKFGDFTASPPTSATGSVGELICESCHDIVRNVAGGNNLLESSLPSDTRPAQPNTLTGPTTTLCEGCHVTATLPAHHPMTGDTLSDGSTLSTSDSSFTRGFVSPATEMGGSGSEVLYPAADTLPCISCHGNGHGGFAGTGARTLRRGFGGASTPSPGGSVAGADGSGIDRQYDIDPTGSNRLITNWVPLCDSCHKTNDND